MTLGCQTVEPSLAEPLRFAPGGLGGVLSPLDAIAARLPGCFSRAERGFGGNGGRTAIPAYVWRSAPGEESALRLGIFAAIHGDEPAGAWATARFVRTLAQRPELAAGYVLHLYPVCNPTGFEDRTRHSRRGKDLNREFWRASTEPEVQFLEEEIRRCKFHGIVTLHSDDTSDGLYGFVNGALLSQHLLEPALRAAEAFLPRNHGPQIDGFPAQRGIIYEGYDGVLRSPPGLRPLPFEITFETPQRASPSLQIEAFHAALCAILAEYRRFMAVAADI